MANPNFSFAAEMANGNGNKDKPPDLGGTSKQQPHKKSFKGMVIGDEKPALPRPKIDLMQEKLASIEFEDGNRLKPKVIIADSVFEGLCAPWRDALVVKLLGKKAGFAVMKDRLARVWKLTAGFNLMDIGNDYFMVKFDKAMDRLKVMEEGPWLIFDPYLTVQTWSEDFTSLKALLSYLE